MPDNFVKNGTPHVCQKQSFCFWLAAVSLAVSFFQSSPIKAQGILSPVSTLPPITLSNAQLAQATAPPQFIPTDVTPFTVSPQRNSFSPGYKFRVFQLLPERLWFDTTTEVSQRLDTNVFFTSSHPKADYAFRALPNVTVGYNVLKNTSVYANYFVIKDVFARHTMLNYPTTQSLSWGIQNNMQLGQKASLQLDFQARELWMASHLRQFDFLPGTTLTYQITPNNIVFGSMLLQLRGGQYFVAPTREIDPFYTAGYLYRRGLWTFVATDTLVTNFRHPPFNDAIPPQSNMSMIADLEVNRSVMKKVPALVAFVRAEPVFNWDSHKEPGISGFDFRFYGGLRLSMSKPSYYGVMDNMRKQILESEAPAGQSKSMNPGGLKTDNNNNGSSGSSADGSTTGSTTGNADSSDGQVQPKLRGI